MSKDAGDRSPPIVLESDFLQQARLPRNGWIVLEAGRMKSASTNDKSQVQVIARAAAILRALENEALGLSLGQIAERVGLARSTVQRIIAALEIEKLVIQASPTGRMRLGPTILRL